MIAAHRRALTAVLVLMGIETLFVIVPLVSQALRVLTPSKVMMIVMWS
jgi:hypothetical protein